jgi:uncharacterized protein YqhQ
MLRAGGRTAVAVRRPDGTIEVRAWEQQPRVEVLDRIPVLRVLTGLASAMRGALRAAYVASRARRGVPGRVRRALALVAFIVFAEGLAVVLWDRLSPPASAWGAVVGGATQLVALVIALAVARLTPYGRRVFTYHGAEHQTVRAQELGFAADVDPAFVATLPSVHDRCGTHLAAWLTVEAGALQVARHGVFASGITQILVVVLTLGVLAEVLRAAAGRDELWARLVRMPGSGLQRLTTRRADAAHCEVALSALDALTPALAASRAGIGAACTSDSAPLLSSSSSSS